MEFNKNKS